MDARERLRRYLEQRRELGEQELVLDRLEVDDVLRMVGALGRTPAASPSPAGPGEPAGEVRGDVGERAPTAEPRVTEPAASFTDWRETLRAAGGGPPGPLTPSTGAGSPAGDEEGEMARARKAGRKADSAADDAPAAAPTRPKAPARPAAAASGPPATSPAWAAELGIPVGLSVGKGAALDDTFAGLRTLDELARATERCTRCDLYRTATHAVPGDGNPDADLVCVGEAPGANEDASGHPFVGAAGQLLTKILAAINLSRDDVFICNVLKHRPPGNRNPQPDEVEACSPYLLRQLELVKPKVILTLGTFAAQTLLATKTPIGKLRGQVHLYHGIPLVVTYHPAALLRNSAWKRPTWEDVQLARRLLDRASGA